MGGYDLFKSEWSVDSNAWSIPINLGYPINTPNDNKMITFIKGEHVAFMSMYKEDGFGDYDIFEVTFNEKIRELTLLRIELREGMNSINSDATLGITSFDTGDIFGSYLPNSNGIYTIILPPGNYKLYIEVEGYEAVFENYTIGSGLFYNELMPLSLPLKRNN